MEDKPLGQEEYIQKVLTAYRQTPGTTGTIRRPARHERVVLVNNHLVAPIPAQ